MRSAESVSRSATTSGTSHNGAWRLCKNSGHSKAPRSAGCSRIYSAPESRAARRSEVARLTSSLASCSSLAWPASTSGKPRTFSLSRTGGGPPSSELGEEKKRGTENVEHGGEATIAA
eukprot:6213078-Pleurochrysis_carterae.AAC.3